jgi:ornithine carbamoyltransferase
VHNLRNRSFLKEIDFATREFAELLRLATALKTAKYAGTARVLGRIYDAIEFRGAADRDVEPYDAISYCSMGDARSNMGRSLVVRGAIMGSDVRLCAPPDLWPPEEIQQLARQRAAESGARVTLTEHPDGALTRLHTIKAVLAATLGSA